MLNVRRLLNDLDDFAGSVFALGAVLAHGAQVAPVKDSWFQTAPIWNAAKTSPHSRPL
jgi:hypothetical protein